MAAGLGHLGLSESRCRGLRLAPGGKQGGHRTCITAPHHRTVPVAARIWGWCRIEVFHPALFLDDKATSKGQVLVLG